MPQRLKLKEHQQLPVLDRSSENVVYPAYSPAITVLDRSLRIPLKSATYSTRKLPPKPGQSCQPAGPQRVPQRLSSGIGGSERIAFRDIIP